MADDRNVRIASNANLAILLIKKEMIIDGTLDKWLEFCKKANLPIMACIISDLDGNDGIRVNSDGEIFECVASGLKREANLSGNKAIVELSEFILRLHGVVDEQAIKLESELTFNIRLEGNRFYLSFGKASSNSEKVIDALNQLESLNLENSLDRSKPALLEGRVSIQVIAAIALRIQQYVKVIAVYDTVDDKYIVISSLDERYKIGDKIL